MGQRIIMRHKGHLKIVLNFASRLGPQSPEGPPAADNPTSKQAALVVSNYISLSRGQPNHRHVSGTFVGSTPPPPPPGRPTKTTTEFKVNEENDERAQYER